MAMERSIFEVKIWHFPSYETSISVGFDVPRDAVAWRPATVAATPRGSIETVGQIGKRGVSIPGITKDGKGRAGIAWKSDGKKEHSISNINVAGTTFTELESFVNGDILTVTLDQDSVVPKVQMYRNGKKLIPSDKCQKKLRDIIRDRYWKTKREHIKLEDGIMVDGDIPVVDYENYELLPAVSMYSSLRHGEPRVECNFGGPFEYPIEGFEGYGADLDKEKLSISSDDENKKK